MLSIKILVFAWFFDDFMTLFFPLPVLFVVVLLHWVFSSITFERILSLTLSLSLMHYHPSFQNQKVSLLHIMILSLFYLQVTRFYPILVINIY